MIKQEFVVMCNKHTYEVIDKTIMKSSRELDYWFTFTMEHNPKCIELGINNIGCSFVPNREYERIMLCEKLGKHTTAIMKKEYGTYKHKRQYSFEQVYTMYHEDYINFNLKNAIKNGFVEAKFIPIKDLFIRPDAATVDWKSFLDNPYLMQWNHDKLELGRSIKKIGTWFPFIVDTYEKDSDKMYIYEGNHRIFSLKLLVMNGELSEDFKVLCIRPLLPHPRCSKPIDKDIASRELKYRFVIENIYGGDALIDDSFNNALQEMIINKGEKFINEYTVEATAQYVLELFEAIADYPYLLKYLIHDHNDSILPSKIINDEEEFEKWIKQEM